MNKFEHLSVGDEVIFINDNGWNVYEIQCGRVKSISKAKGDITVVYFRNNLTELEIKFNKHGSRANGDRYSTASSYILNLNDEADLKKYNTILNKHKCEETIDQIKTEINNKSNVLNYNKLKAVLNILLESDNSGLIATVLGGENE